jgi:acyl-coenzyme A synthetase/AMP-(fatty) acid ligase
MRNWFDYILLHTRTQPEVPAMVMENQVVTYGMLGAAIERCARRIVALNIPAAGLVAVRVANPIRDLILSLALFRIGMRSISLAHGQVGVEQFTYAAILGDRDGARNFDPRARIVEVTDAWFNEDIPTGGDLPPSFSAGGQKCRTSLTSGTTGTPKIVEHSVRGLGRRMTEKLIGCIDVSRSGVLCIPGLSANFGFTTACATLLDGRTVHFVQSPYQALRMIDLLSIDVAIASADQLLALTRVARKSRAHLKSLRLVMTGGSILTHALLEAAMIYVCKEIVCHYAASETGAIAQASARDIVLDPSLVGDVWPGVEVGIFDANGTQCPVDRVGAVKIRHPDDEELPALVDQPWFDLGDLGWFASDGRLHVLGRPIDVDAVNPRDKPSSEVSPVYEVEHLLRLEWDLTDAAAVLVQDRSGGKPQIWIGVVDNSGASAEKLAAIVRPHGIHHPIRLFDLHAIPRGANGKVNRQQLKSQLLSGQAGAGIS